MLVETLKRCLIVRIERENEIVREALVFLDREHGL